MVLNACYSDVQGDAISANIPFTIGMRGLVNDNVAIKFSQGFYDAIGAGKGYESAFKWGKVAIEFDLADGEAAKILVLRKKSEYPSQPIPVPTQTPVASPPTSQRSLSAKEYFNRAREKSKKGDKEGAISDYKEAIHLNPNYSAAYYNRGLIKRERGKRQEALADFRKSLKLYQQQGNTEGYNKSRDRIRLLECY